MRGPIHSMTANLLKRLYPIFLCGSRGLIIIIRTSTAKTKNKIISPKSISLFSLKNVCFSNHIKHQEKQVDLHQHISPFPAFRAYNKTQNIQRIRYNFPSISSLMRVEEGRSTRKECARHYRIVAALNQKL